LQGLHTTIIYTVPISAVYSDKNLSKSFGSPNIMPMVNIYEIKITPDKKLILLITGLEKSIGILEEYPSVLANLNFVRDDLRISVPL
jgi:hypothetical protein